MSSRIQLVPPNLKVIAGLITHKIDLEIAVARLEYRLQWGIACSQLRECGMPEIQMVTTSLGHGLTMAMTRTLDGSGWTRLIWISELACHPMCAFLGRQCQGELSSKDWLEKIQKKHWEVLAQLPSV